MRNITKGNRDLPPEVMGSITEFLNNRKKVHAIKVYRNYTGASLKESKEAVEAIAEGMGIELRGSPGRKKSCLFMTVGFLIWSGLIAFSPAGVEELVQHIGNESISSGLQLTPKIFIPIFLVILSIVLLIMFRKRPGSDRD